MSASKFFASSPSLLIADASIIINLNASGRAADIVKALPHRFAVTGNAIVELEAGERNGHNDAKQLQELIRTGLMERVEIGAAGAQIYETLIDGSTRFTLDDGEAATIACAVEQGGFALLDERKARSVCAASFPALQLACTAELLMHPSVAEALSHDHVATVVRSLQVGRMRVPLEFLSEVTMLLGPDHIAACSSLPKAVRQTV